MSSKSLFMRLALREAEKNFPTLDGGPFGAAIVKNDHVLSVGRSTVLRDQNPVCHAEINAIFRATRQLGSFDLSGCEIYSTTEPCPMCFSAIHWSRISRIYYGTSIQDVKKLGFNELSISNEKMKQLGKSKVKIVKGFSLDDCKQLLSKWKKLPEKKTY